MKEMSVTFFKKNEVNKKNHYIKTLKLVGAGLLINAVSLAIRLAL